jgi:hypothetical protein
VLGELDTRLRAGTLSIADYTDATDLFRDQHHLNGVGRYAAALTMWAVLFRADPAGLPCPEVYKTSTGGEALTPVVIADLKGIVWDVVDGHEYTNVPEPASLALVGFGAFALVRRRR